MKNYTLIGKRALSLISNPIQIDYINIVTENNTQKELFKLEEFKIKVTHAGKLMLLDLKDTSPYINQRPFLECYQSFILDYRTKILIPCLLPNTTINIFLYPTERSVGKKLTK